MIRNLHNLKEINSEIDRKMKLEIYVVGSITYIRSQDNEQMATFCLIYFGDMYDDNTLFEYIQTQLKYYYTYLLFKVIKCNYAPLSFTRPLAMNSSGPKLQ